jgi:hypothetical protein
MEKILWNSRLILSWLWLLVDRWFLNEIEQLNIWRDQNDTIDDLKAFDTLLRFVRICK